ncbi:pyruvate/2-oxoglutarate dehydrogenase complex dihydrolipoamide dehydrogenase (E3) component [Promicromonospora sp. AC04]|uniref:NAD(P)/FAD-dependent oxidoreductase n=1 Tax=Promicromonospora sp. AC04 TaxID=2135723 RepID=UPI000D4745C5|nr:NAD(P)/FAD-dependent oxidoreductase [Promicromonospora sp. AC04]PUB25928.1 pyruvate/2-oxoglutarate dehydrogenase complex dihydrolipoamide dehydrogenase (E3) component [Promicromonospora sp. AC04]
MSKGLRHVVVVGAGPAGLAAARAAAEAGARVTLLDAADGLGGQYWRHLPAARPAGREHVLHHRWSTFGELSGALRANPAVTVVESAQVWSLERPDGGIRLNVLVGEPDAVGRAVLVLEPDALVLATGAHDRTLPFPGWQLPGVYSAGAAQALAKGERVAVGRRVVVAGAGPFLLPVASALLWTGATVVGVHEAAGPGALARGWLSRPWELAGAAGKAGELAGYVGELARHRVPWRPGEAVVAAHGDGQVEAVTIARLDERWAPVAGTERQVEADAVCVSHGFTPRLELAVAAGCALSPSRFVVVDDAQATSVPGVWAAGEITGIGGADAALAEGAVAGTAAAGGDLGVVRVAVRARARARGFAARIEAAHGVRGGWVRWLRDDTVVCRCEETTYGRVREVVELTGSHETRSVKLTSRAGLGPCQARMCGRTLQELLGDAPGGDSDAGGTAPGVDRRPLVVPVRLGDLASLPSTSASTSP